MNTVLAKGNVIARIRRGEDLDQIINYVKDEIYKNGPNNAVVLEIISYFKLFQPEYFKKFEQDIIETMGLFFKHPNVESLAGAVFEMYHQHLTCFSNSAISERKVFCSASYSASRLSKRSSEIRPTAKDS